ncbi:MAG: Glu/Leu/Phe/Val dehydrogenase [Planctomycetaceae bacterium]|nr:Glu/Leu/Phe/Val dehydrogenase [Planctomycetaceae bacterium]
MQISEIRVDGYEKVVRCKDPASGLHALIAVHDTTLGPALGGMRMLPYANEEEALFDVLRLSKGMTYKSAVADTGLGGGKSVILGDAKLKSPALFKAMGAFVDSLGGKYITAEDMNIGVADLELVRSATKWVTGLSRDAGGSGNPSPYTARGAFHGMRAVMEEAFGSPSFKGRRVLIQGVGAVGGRLAELLKEAGAHVIICDINEARVAELSKKHGYESVADATHLDVACDVYSPCARGATINDTTIPKLKCKAIAGVANNQLHEPRHGDILRQKGILYAPDYVINAGGIINVSFELLPGGYDEAKAVAKIDRVYDNLVQVFQIAREQKVSTHIAADRLAERRIAAGKTPAATTKK